MAEYANTASQSVSVNAPVVFATTVEGGDCVTHRDGSGLFTLHGGKRYLVAFSANVTGATAAVEVDLAICIGGEQLPSTLMASTPAAANANNNVAGFVYISVPKCCCYTVSVENVGTTALTCANANIIIIREE